jgi:DNA polymerase-1
LPYDDIIVDCLNLSYRSWWHCRKLTTKAGTATGLEFGFIKNFLSHARVHQPAKVHLAWDGIPIRVLTAFPEYKAKRKHTNQEAEAPWGPRLEVVRNAFTPMVHNYYHPEKEADELIAEFVHQQVQQGRKTLIISTDRDMHQLVSDLTHLDCAEDEILDPAGVEKKWGLPPSQVTYYRAIAGDSSDDIPGIPRIKNEWKIQLAKDAKSLDHLIELCFQAPYLSDTQRTKLKDGTAIIRRNYHIMNLTAQTELPTLIAQPTGDTTLVRDLCRQLELESLLKPERREWRLFSPNPPL